MKVSTTTFLLASLYGSAWAAPVGGDLVGDTLQSVTGKGGLGNVVPGNAATGGIAPVNDLTEGLTDAVGQPGSVVGRQVPIGGDLVNGALQSVTGKGGLGNVVPEDAATGGIAPINDLTEGLTGAVGQPGIVGRDGGQKASVVLPNYDFSATDNTAKVDIRADATNVDARNLDAKAKAQPFAKPPVDVNLDALVDARNLDANAKGVLGQLLGEDAHVKAHPFVHPPVDVNANVLVDAQNIDAKPIGVDAGDGLAQATDSA